jgi:hypothetical protein
MLRVDTYGGKSHNARKLNTYTINVSGLLIPQKPALEKGEIVSLIKEEIKQTQPTNGLGDLGNLLGILTGKIGGKEGMEGLLGLFNTMTGNNKELDRIAYQKQLDDFKFETRQTMLQEKLEKLSSENAELRIDKERYLNENKELKADKSDLEQRLAGYAPVEVAKRMGIGAVVNIGSRLLTNSPKTAQLLGLSAHELKTALGVVDVDDTEEATIIPETNVEISEVGTEQTPEEIKKTTIIKNISEALATWGLHDVAKIANIVGLCLDKAELINKTLAFLRQSMQEIQSKEAENKDLDNEN